jgi:hypothetical protein
MFELNVVGLLREMSIYDEQDEFYVLQSIFVGFVNIDLFRVSSERFIDRVVVRLVLNFEVVWLTSRDAAYVRCGKAQGASAEHQRLHRQREFNMVVLFKT